MAKIVNISEIHPTLGFTEFDILEKYRKSFNESELGKLHSVFPFECMAKAAGLSDRRLGRRNRFSPSAKIALMVLKAYTGFSDRQLVEHLNGNIHYQIFCGIMIPPSLPITNFKIVSAIRNEIASRLDIDSFQELLASHWKPYLDNLHVCMTDATCYESHMRFPTDMKLLWESLEWLYRHICRHCRELGIRRPRNKYRNVAESYLSYCKKKIVFRFTNVSSGPVVITRVMTSCECTSAVWDKAPLLPGRRSRIEVTYEAERDGVFFRKLFIYHAGAASPFEIAIEGVGEE